LPAIEGPGPPDPPFPNNFTAPGGRQRTVPGLLSSFTALEGQAFWIVSQPLLEERSCTFFSSLGEPGAWMLLDGHAYQLSQTQRQTPLVGSLAAAGCLHVTARDGEPTLSLLVDSGATVHVAGQGWQQCLNTDEGLGSGSLNIMFDTTGGRGCAQVLKGPLAAAPTLHGWTLHFIHQKASVSAAINLVAAAAGAGTLPTYKTVLPTLAPGAIVADASRHLGVV